MPQADGRASALREEIEAALAACALARYPGATAAHEAARYVLAGGGKRVRPVLCLLSAEALGGTGRAALPAALALEFVHTYSLVHDDLPCMDDDALRRGRPTAHLVYGEADALLAGDALLTDAFAILSTDGDLESGVRLALIAELAAAAGGRGMVLGQSLDLYWTARPGATRSQLDEIHLKKTGCLLGASAAMGAIVAGASPAVTAGFRAFGQHLGLSFQILDDVLDDTDATGKSPGKDQAAGKLTYLAVMSRPDARKAADQAAALALDALAATRADTAALGAFVAALLQRTR